ncbi:MAG: winged helix-turn-helix domain-containing protein, partial [Thermomicrobiales bacterium]
LDTVWGSDVIVDERTVDVHVSWLRGTLQEAGLAEDMVRTVYGSGYRFVVPKGADHLGAPGDEHPSPFEHSPPRLRGGTATG